MIVDLDMHNLGDKGVPGEDDNTPGQHTPSDPGYGDKLCYLPVSKGTCGQKCRSYRRPHGTLYLGRPLHTWAEGSVGLGYIGRGL